MLRLSPIFILCSLLASQLTADHVTWHVNGAEGSDSASGNSPESPFATIQHALNNANAGDTISVAPGVYHELIRWERAGTSEAPIRLLAEDANCYATVLSAANPEVRQGKVHWELVDADLQLYRIPFPHYPTRILADRIDVPPYPSLEDLKAFRFLADNYPGTRHGFTWDKESQMLYIRLFPDGRYGPTDPNQRTMAVAPPTGGGRWGTTPNREDNYLISIPFKGEAHLIIDGFTFETPGVAGISIEADNVTVRNSWFFGCRYGVAGLQSADASDVIIEHCFYTQYPAFADSEEVILREAAQQRKRTEWWQRIMHWQRKGGFPVAHRGIGSPYAYETGLVRRIGINWTVQNNWLWEVFEGFSAGSVSHSRHANLVGNRVERVCDNAFETEDRAYDIRISGNLVIDAFEPFSWQPMHGFPLPGPVYITDNIILQTPQVAAIWEASGNTGGIAKIGCKDDRNWNSGGEGMTPIDIAEAPGGFWFAHNTIIVPRGRVITSLNPASRSYKNFWFINNIFATANLSHVSPQRLSGVTFLHNAVWLPQADADARLLAAGTGGYIAESLEALDIQSQPAGANTPLHDSPAVGLGVTQHTLQLSDGTTLEIPATVQLRATSGALAFKGGAGPALAPSPDKILSLFSAE